MKNEHITHLLDGFKFDGLSRRELETIKSHVVDCDDCRQSFAARRIAAVGLRVRAAETIMPSPFFETRLMAAWRERQTASVAAFWRWWQASSALIAVMLLAVAGLIVFTVMTPNSGNVQTQASVVGDYSTEKVILNEPYSNTELTTRQALQIIYEPQNDR